MTPLAEHMRIPGIVVLVTFSYAYSRKFSEAEHGGALFHRARRYASSVTAHCGDYKLRCSCESCVSWASTVSSLSGECRQCRDQPFG